LNRSYQRDQRGVGTPRGDLRGTTDDTDDTDGERKIGGKENGLWEWFAGRFAEACSGLDGKGKRGRPRRGRFLPGRMCALASEQPDDEEASHGAAGGTEKVKVDCRAFG